MKTELTWSNKMLFHAHAGHHEVSVDAKAPIGADPGMPPKELLQAIPRVDLA